MVWTKGGEEVQAGGRFRFLFEDEETIALIIKSTLIYILNSTCKNDRKLIDSLKDVEMGDAGLYTVVASNNLGQVTTEGRLASGISVQGNY